MKDVIYVLLLIRALIPDTPENARARELCKNAIEDARDGRDLRTSVSRMKNNG